MLDPTTLRYRPDRGALGLLVGEWKWFGATRPDGVFEERAGVLVCLPNGELAAFGRPGIRPQRLAWNISGGDDGLLSLSPAIAHKPGLGSVRGEWHGLIQGGEMIEVGGADHGRTHPPQED